MDAFKLESLKELPDLPMIEQNMDKELFGDDAEYEKLDFEYSLGQIMHYDSRSDMYVKYYNEVNKDKEEEPWN